MEAQQTSIFEVSPEDHPRTMFSEAAAVYETPLGIALLGDALDHLREVPSSSIDLVMTSPPYALHFEKEYGNVEKSEYTEWFSPFAVEIKRVLKPEGSFVLNIGGSYNAGEPTRSLYQFRLLLHLVDNLGFKLAQEFFWYNPAKLPAPAEWVNVRRMRVKDSIEYVWWLTPTGWPKANNRSVLVPYSKDMKKLIKRGLRDTVRPSGHNITSKFSKDHGGAIPANFFDWGNNDSNSAYMKACKDRGINSHPARYPWVLPSFFTRFLTDPGDIVLDPFAGSNTTGWIAEELKRYWIAIDMNGDYLRASGLRFEIDLLEPTEVDD